MGTGYEEIQKECLARGYCVNIDCKYFGGKERCLLYQRFVEHMAGYIDKVFTTCS